MSQPNRLIDEVSPYLQQHAHNPVDWYPWGAAAFARARDEDKPIFLSIGYSTCHWCHVMAHESFEDAEVAALLNDRFVAIKVDREERPDIDQVYMTACQEMTGQGGWPLTILMTADGKPFFAGTYFPKRTKWGRAGLMDILGQVARLWGEDRQRLVTSSEQITASIFANDEVETGTVAMNSADPGVDEVSPELLDRARRHFGSAFDDRFGGFGGAPKFPTPHNLIFLLRDWKRTGDENALRMVETTLRAMHSGGIYDHIGFGFARYSTDRRWLIPHFEKMLYDNALLTLAYLEAYQATGEPLYARVAREVFDYVGRVMTSPEGGFYSAEDADSEGVEGKFYVWSRAEIDKRLGPDAELFCDAYGVSEQGNFEGENVLNLIGRDLATLARVHDLTGEGLERRLAAARKTLFAAREERVHPHKDDKVLTAWNGLMIAALARGAAILGDRRYADMARRATEMIERNLVSPEGRLLARYRSGQAGLPGYIDDYAFYIFGLHELFSATADPALLERAGGLLHDTIRLFWDDARGGFFFTGTDAETLIARPKELYDGALPSGNSVMALNLVRHSRLTGDEELADYAERQLRTFADTVARHPSGYTFFLQAVQIAVGGGIEVVVAEGRNADVFAAMRERVHQRYLPFAVVLPKTRSNSDAINRLAPAHRDKGPLDDRTALYLCENFACQKPLTTLAEVEQRLQ